MFGDYMINKQFKTVQQQIDYLIREKNIDISFNFSNILHERQYTSIINPYKVFFATGFANGIHQYKDKTDFENYIQMASLDDSISNILFKQIGIFERKLKVTLGHLISKNMYYSNDKEAINYSIIIKKKIMLDNDNNNMNQDEIREINEAYKNIGFDSNISIFGHYENNEEKFKERWFSLLTKIVQIGNLEKVVNNKLVNHYIDKHNAVPFWVLIHGLSLGELQSLYNILNIDLKKEIYTVFYPQESNPNPKELRRLSSRINLIREFRNTVNHYESIICDFLNGNLDQNIGAIKLLKSTYLSSEVTKYSPIELETISINDYNKDKLNTLNEIKRAIEN